MRLQDFVRFFLALFTFWHLFGCVSLPSKDANLTDVYKPVTTGGSEVEVPGEMLGGPEGSVFKFKGDSNKNTSLVKREWYENGNMKSEITAGGDRSNVIDATTSGIQEIESNRIGARLQQLEMTIAVFERTLDKVLTLVSSRMTATSAPVNETSKIDKIFEILEKLQGTKNAGSN